MTIKKRITWVDVAKGMTILLMIIGHVFPYASSTRNLIFSFHMPLFFTLTGFTARPANSWKALGAQIKKDFEHIMLPCIGAWVGDFFLRTLFYGGGFTENLILWVRKLFWAAAMEYQGHPSLGALWFLVVLFWSKILLSVIPLIFKSKYSGSIYLFCAILGKMISGRCWLPQSFDVVLVAVLFLYIGQVFKQYYEKFAACQMPLTYIAFVIWMLCWHNGLYIEVGTRSYPQFVLTIIEALCGCICVFTLARAIEGNVWTKRIFTKIGQHTLAVLCAHHLAWNFAFVWDAYGLLGACAGQLIFSFGIAAMLLTVKYIFLRMGDKHRFLQRKR